MTSVRRKPQNKTKYCWCSLCLLSSNGKILKSERTFIAIVVREFKSLYIIFASIQLLLAMRHSNNSSKTTPSIAATKRRTSIVDMNDDCMFEVFKYLRLIDLCVVADVCQRFRQNAKRHFASVKVKKIYRNNYFRRSITFPNLPEGLKISKLKHDFLIESRVVRNFGAFINLMKFTSPNKERVKAINTIREYERRIVETLSMHSVEALTELDLKGFDITDEIATTMRPLLERLHSLTLESCKWDKLFGKMLPKWSAELIELKIDLGWMSIPSELEVLLYQSFLKLESISFSCVEQLTNDDIDEFLKRNPQLKKIGFAHCRLLDDNIFQSIAEYVPGIESIRIDRVSQSNDSNSKCFGKLTNLKSLELYNCRTADVINVLNEINAANIPVEHLKLYHVAVAYDSNHQLVDGILKMKMLKTLLLQGSFNLMNSQLIDICHHLSELSELRVINTFDCDRVHISAECLLPLIRNAQKLKSLYVFYTYVAGNVPRICIDGSAYMEMVQIVRQRDEKQNLSIYLGQSFTSKIPKELINNYKDTVTLVWDVEWFNVSFDRHW